MRAMSPHLGRFLFAKDAFNSDYLENPLPFQRDVQDRHVLWINNAWHKHEGERQVGKKKIFHMYI